MKLFKRSFLLLALTATLGALSSCAGYKLGPVKPTAMADIRTMAVPTFKNETQEPKIQVLSTNALISQLQLDGTYQISTLDKADAVIRATIKDVDKRALRGARTDVLKTSEFEVSVVIEFMVEDLNTGTELDHGTVTGRTSIFLDPNLQLTERQAIQQAVEKLALTLTSRLTEGY